MTMTDDDEPDAHERETRRSQNPDGSAADTPARADFDDDPLAELIRIVKQEDPFADILADRKPRAPEPKVQAEPPVAAAGMQAHKGQPEARNVQSAPPIEVKRNEAHEAEASDPEAESTSESQHAADSKGESADEAQRAAPQAEDAYIRRPPSLDPIDLDQALRDFRDAPEEILRRDTGWIDDGLDADASDMLPGLEEPRLTDKYVPAAIAGEAAPAYPYGDPALAGYEQGAYPEFEGTAGDLEAPIETPYTAEQHDGDGQGSERRPRRGTFFAVGIVIGLMLLGSASAYFYRQGAGPGAWEELPVIRADNEPVKIAPDDPGGATIPNQERLVFNRVSGETDEPEPRIVSREEEIIAPAKEEARFGTTGDATSDTASGAAGSDAPVETRSERGSLTPIAPTPGQPVGIAPVPRRVKTVVVRPDGSIVASEPVPTVASTPAPAAEEPEPAQMAASNDPTAAGVPVPPVRPENAPALVASADDGSRVAPVQPVRQTGAPLALNPQAVERRQETSAPLAQVARAEPPQSSTATQGPASAAPASAAPASAASGQYVVQLAARRSEAQATEAFNSLKSQYSLLGRYQPLIQRADLGERGVYYRVRVGPMASAAAAGQVCEQLKAAGLPDCLVRPR